MREIPARQVHLDFHTSPLIPGVGADFDKRQFQKTLKEGHVQSITIFAKCHHGYCYYPTKIGQQHPGVKPGFDLTGAIIEACHEIGVKCPVYITIGWSALDADNHPEWLMRDRDGNPLGCNFDYQAAPEDEKPEVSWKDLCMDGPYGDYVLSLTREVCDRYAELDGLFFDICFRHDVCYCDNCRAAMKQRSFDADSEADAREYYRIKHIEFMKKAGEILREKHPEATIFFNGGADINKPEYLPYSTHLEMEDLPTAWGGYNKMPPRASLMERTGKEYLGMTGKFHTTWGEFGGYKNPEALKYEVLTMAMHGAKCSIGDHMPPCGQLDEETYKIIGTAYRALEEVEEWAYPSTSTADVAVYLSRDGDADTGLHTILLESHIDFDTILEGDSLDRYKLVILPDCVQISEKEAERLTEYAAQGGKVIFGYQSAVKDGRILLDAGVRLSGKPSNDRDYLAVRPSMRLPFGNAPFVCYRGAVQLEQDGCEVLADLYEPYFTRNYAHYCGHMHAPYGKEPSASPAIARKGNIIYYAHPLCGMYKRDGAQLFREVMLRMILSVYTPRYTVALPSAGRACLRYQKERDRYVFHMSYASPIKRGRTEVIEDIVPLYDRPVDISMAEPVRSVNLVPQMDPLPFTCEDGHLRFVLPKLECYQAIEIR